MKNFTAETHRDEIKAQRKECLGELTDKDHGFAKGPGEERRARVCEKLAPTLRWRNSEVGKACS